VAWGGVVSPARLDFPLLEERQLFAEEEVLRSQRAAGLRRRQNEPTETEQDRNCRANTVLQGDKEDG